MPSIRATQFDGYLDVSRFAPAKTLELVKDDKTKIIASNQEYEKWLKEDQQLFTHINNFLSGEILGQVATMTTSASVWTVLKGMYLA
jgi:hypothetical protein